MADLKAPPELSGSLRPELVVKNLSYGYGRRNTLSDINLGFGPGLCFLVGPNGAGKSTLLALLARLISPGQGEIRLLGRPLEAYSPRELARLVSLAPQKSVFNLAFTVEEIVAMGRRPYLGRWGVLSPQDKRVVEASLGRLGLTKLAGRAITALSGGEAQRAVIARALAQDTLVTLLDEPTASLDIAQSLELMVLLGQLADAGRVIVVVSHDLSLAAVYARQMAFLREGKLVGQGDRAMVFRPDLLEKVFSAEAKVGEDDFTGGLSISFRPIKSASLAEDLNQNLPGLDLESRPS
ncbi:MAG: ABC transporter ATP-binding protein [Deltaproteobacteria bacterium]|jgi:iron complex transport system ATP-binding protein|nr:ABC transporter ATP-binding protein [Deltaproteobacteria bacterium]